MEFKLNKYGIDKSEMNWPYLLHFLFIKWWVQKVLAFFFFAGKSQCTNSDSGVIYWESSKLSDQSTTWMWHDLHKQIPARVVHTVNTSNWHCICAGVFRNNSFYRSTTNTHCSLLNTQRAELLSGCHCETMSVSNKLWTMNLTMQRLFRCFNLCWYVKTFYRKVALLLSKQCNYSQ